MSSRVSVVITTHNPALGLFERTLAALAAQTLDPRNWELVIVDNASLRPLHVDEIPYRGTNVRLFREERLGPTYGRLRGIRESEGELVVNVDDDNVLASDYLEAAISIFECDRQLGAAGGAIIPEWCEEEPESWVSEFLWALALRDFGSSALVSKQGLEFGNYPHFAPIGAGMVMRRAALERWLEYAESTGLPGRQGDRLAYCEDTEMVIEALRSGRSVGYFPVLKLLHLIPARRLRVEYLGRLLHAGSKSWVLVTQKHGIATWAPAAPWTIPLRKLRAYVRGRAWTGPAEYVRWKQACGVLEGRAAIGRL